MGTVRTRAAVPKQWRKGQANRGRPVDAGASTNYECLEFRSFLPRIVPSHAFSQPPASRRRSRASRSLINKNEQAEAPGHRGTRGATFVRHPSESFVPRALPLRHCFRFVSEISFADREKSPQSGINPPQRPDLLSAFNGFALTAVRPLDPRRSLGVEIPRVAIV